MLSFVADKLEIPYYVYLANGLTNTVPMLDDGLHRDGAAGDGVYGAQLPTQPLGTLVRYFVHAVDAATRQLTDPSGAPLNPNLYSYTVGAVTDSVGDGIADSWRAQYFGGDGTTTNAASAASADPDGDGFSNYQEYLAGTNPTNALSCFHILSIDATPGQPVRFQSATNRTYTLYVRTNLLGGAWTAVPGQSNVPGTGGLMSLTNPLSADTERFFRISVQ